MSHLKNENDPFIYLYKQFSSLEFKSHQTIKSLIKNYYPLNKDEEIFIKDITIQDKNLFISQIKEIFHELSISMETIEYLFNEYYHFITDDKDNKNNNPFEPLQKSEVINKLGISSNMYKKILELYFNILYELKDKKKNLENDMEIEDEEKHEINQKLTTDQKIVNINTLSYQMQDIFENYRKNKKESSDKDNNKSEENIKDKKIYGNINLTKEEEEKLKKKLEEYENNIL